MLDAPNDTLYLYDKLNSVKVVREVQQVFSGAYYNNSMRCLVFPMNGAAVLHWLQDSQRLVLTERGDYEGAHNLVAQPLAIPDDL